MLLDPQRSEQFTSFKIMYMFFICLFYVPFITFWDRRLAPIRNMKGDFYRVFDGSILGNSDFFF